MSQTIKCLVVDDEPLAGELIQEYISQVPALELVAYCWNAMEAFEILKKETIDLVFLDIQMPVLDGMEFVKSLQDAPAVIFTTAYRDYAVESYELDIIDYLLKPITFPRFFKAVNKYFNQLDHTPKLATKAKPQVDTESFIYVNTNRKHIKVVFDEILFVESLKDYIKIQTYTEAIVTKDRISEFERKLPSPFLRVHRSFIVNTAKLSAYSAHEIEIGDQKIPIGISYKKAVSDFFDQS